MALQPTYNPYVSQYVAPPIEEYAQTAQYFQKEYDENMLASEKLKTMMNSVKTLPGDKLRLANQLKQYEDKLGQLSKDGNWEDSSLKVRNLATDFTGNYQAGEIGQLANSYTNYQQYIGDKQKLGNDYAAYNDPYLKYQASGNTYKDGSYKGFNYGGMGKREDHSKAASDLIGTIAEDSDVQAGMQQTADGTGFVFSKDKNGGVALKKIQVVAAQKASMFATSKEGQDYLRMLEYGVNRKLTAQERYDESRKYLEKSAYNQLSIKHDENISRQTLPKYLLKGGPDDEGGPLPTSGYTDMSGNPLMQHAADIADGYETADDGTLSKITVSAEHTQAEMEVFAMAGAQGDVTNTRVVKPIDPKDIVGVNLQKSMNQLMSNEQRIVRETNANLQPGQKPIIARTPKQLFSAHQEAQRNSDNVAVRYIRFNPQMIASKTKQLMPTGSPLEMLSGGQVVLLDAGGKGGKSFQSAAELPGEVQEVLAARTSRGAVKGRALVNPYGMPGAYAVTVTTHGSGTGAGKDYNLLVQASPEEEAAMGTLADMSEGVYSGSPQTDVALPKSTTGEERYLRIVNHPNANKKFEQTVEMRTKTKSGIDKVSIIPMQRALDELYREEASKEFKKFRLTSDSQSNAKGEEKDNNVFDPVGSDSGDQ